ncbi:MAG: DUF3592 domain-containing protein [Acidimicrobiia bacterium]|nr:DUF3592 domain-containing protein [Acidimicrobiia bacterium]
MSWIVWVVLFVGAFVFAIRTGGQRYRARMAHLAAEQQASATWPTTTGSILTSQVISRTAGATDARYTVYSALVTYRFTVGASTYDGNQVRAGQNADTSNRPSFDRPEQAAAEAGRYPVGATITVHYDLRDPARSCLEV